MDAVADERNGQNPQRRPGRAIGYCCVARAHWRKPAPRGATNTLTIVEGEWAFCPHDAMVNSHDWQATGGLELEDLRRMIRRGKPDDFGDRRAAKKV